MRNRIPGLMALIITALTVFAGRPATAQLPPVDDAKKLIESNYQQIKEIINTVKEETQMHDRIRERMEAFVDFRLFGQLALKNEWDQLKPSEQEEYLALFKKLIQRTYLKRFKANKPFSVVMTEPPEVAANGEKVLVKSVITSAKTSADVFYKLYAAAGSGDGPKQWRVYDVIVDEVSYVQNYRTSFQKTWEKGGYKLLIAKMKKKADKAVNPDEKEDDL